MRGEHVKAMGKPYKFKLKEFISIVKMCYNNFTKKQSENDFGNLANN